MGFRNEHTCWIPSPKSLPPCLLVTDRPDLPKPHPKVEVVVPLVLAAGLLPPVKVIASR
jgi:hypothetical protein